jgi:Anti-sigma-K factor rskA
MSHGPDLRELVGDVRPEELEELREVDALLRSVPAPPPALPPHLARPPAQPAPRRSSLALRRRSPVLRRLAIAAALVAALGLSFAAGGLVVGDGEDFEARAAIPLEATEHAPGASAVIRLGDRDASGTWKLEVTASGLRKLPPGWFYILWLAKDGKYAGTCGTFKADGGAITRRWDVAYRLKDYDEWVISARPPGLPRDPRLRPWLLHAKTRA